MDDTKLEMIGAVHETPELREPDTKKNGDELKKLKKIQPKLSSKTSLKLFMVLILIMNLIRLIENGRFNKFSLKVHLSAHPTADFKLVPPVEALHILLPHG